MNKKQDRLSLEKIYEIVDELYKKGLFVIYYTFGEPLIYPQLEKVISYCNKLGLVQILMTNGYYLTADRAEKLSRLGISEICVSIDSSIPSQHDNNRGVEGAYIHAIRAIRTAKSARIPVCIATTITESNYGQIYDIYELGDKYKVNGISFLRERKNGRIQMDEFEPYNKFAEEYIIKENKKINVLFHDPSLLKMISNLYKEGKIREEDFDKYYEMNKCHANCTLSIAPSGDVSHCNLAPQIIGNVVDEPVRKILSKVCDLDEYSVYCL